jgi:5,10-methylenetetrahydrofolate reductase
VVHVSCRDRNRLALQSQVVGATALGAEGVLCVHGDPVNDVPRVRDLTPTAPIRNVQGWAAPQSLAVGAVVNPFADDLDRELAPQRSALRAECRHAGIRRVAPAPRAMQHSPRVTPESKKPPY